MSELNERERRLAEENSEATSAVFDEEDLAELLAAYRAELEAKHVAEMDAHHAKLVATEDKLAATRKELAEARDRLATIVDEAFGTQPIMSMDELLSTLESEIHASGWVHEERLAEARATIERLEASIQHKR